MDEMSPICMQIIFVDTSLLSKRSENLQGTQKTPPDARTKGLIDSNKKYICFPNQKRFYFPFVHGIGQGTNLH